MSTERYMLLMLKCLSARGSLFLFVRTHQHLGYYFNLADTRLAANQSGAARPGAVAESCNVVQIHPLCRAASRPQ